MSLTSFVVISVVIFQALVQCQSYPRLEHWNQQGVNLIENNSFIERSLIEEEGGSLRCVTDNPTCCSTYWSDNNGVVVPSLDSGTNITHYYTTEELIVDGHRSIGLKYRRDNAINTVGLFRCDVPNIYGVIQSFYVYVGTNTIGEGTLRSIDISYAKHPRYVELYQIPEFILTCRSVGGPITTVKWWRNNVPVQEDTHHRITQIIEDPLNVVYLNRLTVWGREGGTYRCRVSNNIPEYYPNLTYLSNNFSSLAITVARRPRNVEHFRDSETSVSIHWNTPSITPLGYIIYYNKTSSNEIFEVRVNASDEHTQTYILHGVNRDDYSISMLSLSEYLPSGLVGSPIISVADITPSVTVSSTSGDPEAGISYTLTCTVTLIPGADVIPTIVWSSPGMLMTWVNTSGVISNPDGTYTRQLTFRPLILAHSGEYTCITNFTINQVTSRDGSKAFILSVIIPQPSVLVSIIEEKVPYIGNNVSVECSVELNPAVTYSEVDVDVRWRKDGRRYTGESDEARIVNGVTHSSISFSYLLESDSGWYECTAILSPREVRVNSPQLVVPTLYNLTAIVPSLIIQVSPSIVRILDHPPYNEFVLSCTIRAEVYGNRVPLALSMQWNRVKRRGARLPSSDYEVNGSPRDGYQSVLTRSETDSQNTISYRCRASFVLDVNRVVNQFSESFIAIVGPTTPVIPVSIQVIGSDSNSVTIQWTISSIAYTPETYYVEYGTNMNQLDQQSPSQDSGSNIMIHEMTYSQELNNLQPEMVYYYRVFSTNDVGSSASRVQSVRTTELISIQSSGSARVGQSYTLSCIVAESDIGDVTELTWTDALTGVILNTSSQSQLELVFQPLELSDVGSYTCSVTYSNGDSRQLTEQVMAKVPTPDVQLVENANEIVYSGLNHSLQCIVTLSDLASPYVTVSIEWIKNNDYLKNCSKLIFVFDTVIQCSLEFTPLSYTRDNGSYACRAVIHSKPSYPFLRSQTILSGSLNIAVAVPNVIVAMSTSTNHILDVAPYNQFIGYCTASVSIPGLADDSSVQLMRQWQWKRKTEIETEFRDVAGASVILSNVSDSVLHHYEVISGEVTYKCVYSLEGVDNVFAGNEVKVSVIGVGAPNMPQKVGVLEIFQESVIIHWTIPSIAYTPETYLVEYGMHSDSLGLSEAISSGTDIEIVDQMYSVELKNLMPGTKYHYLVTAQNSAGTTKSASASFYTKERVPGRVSFVIASRVNDTSLNISWGLADPSNGNITHYIIWINSTLDNHTREVSAFSPRTLIITGLTRKTAYRVYVAAVNEAGRGEWQETMDTVTTQGIVSATSDESVGEAVGATIAVFILCFIIIIVALLLLVVCVRRRHRKGTGLILTTEMRSSALLNNIIKVEPKRMSESPEPLESNGRIVAGSGAAAIAAQLEVEQGRRNNGAACGGGNKEIEDTTDSDDDISKDSNNDEHVI